MAVARVALIFDDETRPETTGVYCLRALEGLVEVEHFRPAELGRVPRDGFDLYLNIDDGLSYTLPAALHPVAWWAIDTHMDFEGCLTRSHDFDFVFAAQRDGAERLCDEGISTTWLPLGCDPEVHRKHEVEKALDVCFVGNVFPGERAELLRLLCDRFPNHFVGQRYFEEMARTYSASRVVFNRSVRNDVNMRVFEAVACGSLLLTNDLRDNGQEELFRDGVHLATYRDTEEMVDKVRFYLAREAARERIAAAGRAEALARHTYRHRMERILAEVDKRLARRSPHRAQSEAARPAGDAVARNGPPPPSAAAFPAVPADLSYFEFARPELLALIPASARRVLDVGCGAGRLGEALKARQSAEVVGVELVEAAAEAARTRLDLVHHGNVEEMELPFAPGSFDAVVCGDVLEHLRQPGRFLRKAHGWLRPGGRLIASVPNVRHHSVVRALLDGNWTYESAGLLDRDHVRFFTRRAVKRLFRRAGFTVRRLEVVPGPGYREWQAQGRPGEVKVGRLRIGGLAPEDAEEFFAYQYLVVARAARHRGRKPAARRGHAAPTGTSAGGRPRAAGVLRFLHLGNFANPWSDETAIASALLAAGHRVTRMDESQASTAAVLAELNGGRHDCLLFSKGRIGTCSPDEWHSPTGEAICEVLRAAAVPCYLWYFDRAFGYPQEPSREPWMRKVAPLCRVAFTTEAALARTDWARWHVLRLGVDPATVLHGNVPEDHCHEVGFVGQVYGRRAEELARLREAFTISHIQGVHGSALSGLIRSHKIIIGPHYPSAPGYWSNRLYVVLGHGGFFLAPEVQGMRAEGFLPGVHYAALGSDPVADVRHWLDRPRQRERIAGAGQELVLRRHTFAHRVAELCRVIAETL